MNKSFADCFHCLASGLSNYVGTKQHLSRSKLCDGKIDDYLSVVMKILYECKTTVCCSRHGKYGHDISQTVTNHIILNQIFMVNTRKCTSWSPKRNSSLQRFVTIYRLVLPPIICWYNVRNHYNHLKLHMESMFQSLNNFWLCVPQWNAIWILTTT